MPLLCRGDIYNVALSSTNLELSIVAAGLERLSERAAFLAQLQQAVGALGVAAEVIDAPADPRGFGHALRAGLRQARGAWIITVDPDFAGPMTFIADLWARRHDAEI